MDASALKDLRKSLGLTQAEMADRIGMTLRPYAELESGRSEFRPIHARAAERAALAVAIERGNPMLAPISIRREALELARLITG